MSDELNSAKKTNDAENPIKIKMFGIGGGGCNSIDTMIRRNFTGIEFIAGNTDLQALNKGLAPFKVQLGKKCSQGLGAGGNKEIGREAAEEQAEEIKETLSGTKLLFIVACMGGGTGTGGAPVIARIAREMGILTVCVVTKPFAFEGRYRMINADQGIRELQQHSDTLITVYNQNLFFTSTEETTVLEAFDKIDDFLYCSLSGLKDLIVEKGHINRDFADIKAVMNKTSGEALMGIGEGGGEGGALKAATEAISSPLLGRLPLHTASAVLVNIMSGTALKLSEVQEVLKCITDVGAEDEVKTIYGVTIDPKFEDTIRVLVVATGIQTEEEKSQEIETKKDVVDGSLDSAQYLREEQILIAEAPPPKESGGSIKQGDAVFENLRDLPEDFIRSLTQESK